MICDPALETRSGDKLWGADLWKRCGKQVWGAALERSIGDWVWVLV